MRRSWSVRCLSRSSSASLVAEPFEDLGRERGVEQRFAGRDPGDRVDQVARLDLLEDVAVGAGHDRVEQGLVVGVRGEHQAVDLGVLRADLAAHLDAVAVGQATRRARRRRGTWPGSGRRPPRPSRPRPRWSSCRCSPAARERLAGRSRGRRAGRRGSRRHCDPDRADRRRSALRAIDGTKVPTGRGPETLQLPAAGRQTLDALGRAPAPNRASEPAQPVGAHRMTARLQPRTDQNRSPSSPFSSRWHRSSSPPSAWSSCSSSDSLRARSTAAAHRSRSTLSEFKITPATIEAAAGNVMLSVTNGGTMVHNLSVTPGGQKTAGHPRRARRCRSISGSWRTAPTRWSASSPATPTRA